MSSVILVVLLLCPGLVPWTLHTPPPPPPQGIYSPLPKFWTSTGLCPRGGGDVQHEVAIRHDLLSDTMLLNLRVISALPPGALTHIRIHWLPELLRFQQFSQAGVPEYDFDDLDKFLDYLSITLKLHPVIEFMGNLSNLFRKNPLRNPIIWENLVYQILKRYSARYGWKVVKQWRFETWNEPDLLVYNKLNFTLNSYLEYVKAVNKGLQTISKEQQEMVYSPLLLRGPAGLLKAEQKHPLCWGLLAYCGEEHPPPEECPIGILTYHRKGTGQNISELMRSSKLLWQQILEKYPSLQALPISNDEADPISGWSRARAFHSDVRYALAVVRIIIEHWRNTLLLRPSSSNEGGRTLFKLDSISHDNAFVSYHPFEFTQRTLLAHFRMNETCPPHSQFIQKPVYAALGLMARLGSWAAVDDDKLHLDYELLTTTSSPSQPDGNFWYFNWLLWRGATTRRSSHQVQFKPRLFLNQSQIEQFIWTAIAEVLDQNNTNPFKVWQGYSRPAYPNATVRLAMRMHQLPRLLDASASSEDGGIQFDLSALPIPWLVSVRMCGRRSTSSSSTSSNVVNRPDQPLELQVIPVTHNEVFITWQTTTSTDLQSAEDDNNYQNSCLKTFEVWFRATTTTTTNWTLISDKHLPFPSFHYAPTSPKAVNGFYRVRAVDVFNVFGPFSDIYEYIEI